MTPLLRQAALAPPLHPAAAAAKAEGLGGVPRAVAVTVAVAEDVAATTRRRQHLLLLLLLRLLNALDLGFWWALNSRVCQRYEEFNE